MPVLTSCLRGFVPIVVAVLSLSATKASAQSEADQERAHQHCLSATSYYSQSRYVDAAREFREAYRLSGRTHLLKNVATSHERAGAFAEAVAALEEYLAQTPDADDRRQVEGRLEELRARAAEETPTETPPPAPAEGQVEPDPDPETTTTDAGAAMPPTDGASSEPSGVPILPVVLVGVGAAALVAALV